jgi:hypothetical protein
MRHPRSTGGARSSNEAIPGTAHADRRHLRCTGRLRCCRGAGWPYSRDRWPRRATADTAAALSPLIGFSRSLAVYVVSDVVAGYFVRVTWAVVLAAAFHVWQRAAPPGMSAC